MSDIKEHLKMAQALSGNLKKMIQKQNNAISNLPVEHQKKLQPYQKDIAKALQTLKDGDLTGLQQIINTHAGTDIK
eukprot:SAG25_NODE_188_length_12354_cov_23.716116_6_plen_76_part_00